MVSVVDVIPKRIERINDCEVSATAVMVAEVLYVLQEKRTGPPVCEDVAGAEEQVALVRMGETVRSPKGIQF